MAENFVVSPSTQLIDTDPKSPGYGKLTRDGFLLLQSLTRAINAATSDYVLLDAVQTITGKTLDGDANTFQDIPTSALKTKTGNGGRVVTAAAAGTSGRLAQWDASGNLVDTIAYTPTSGLVGLLIEDAITNGEVTKAPTENAVFDALALKVTTAFAPNATVATVLGSFGPVGANTTVQKWLAVDDGGTTRYVPCF